ncbi:MAG TPA: nicotinate-nucleotide--dimethylbenzimidazole phosphoribosyltransferase, partial [Spirochaetia bacterium]
MRETVSVRIPDIDRDGMRRAADRIEHLIMPRRALGRLLELGEKVAGITGFDAMDVSKKTIVVMAGDHGVTEEGVSAYPQEVTGQMVRGFVAGGAGINVLSRHAGIDIRLVDMGCAADFADLVRSGAVIDAKIARGTRNMKKGPAMSRAEAVRCIEAGIAVARDAVAAGARMIGTGDMGIGNTTPSTAI